MGKISNVIICGSIGLSWLFLHVMNTSGWFTYVGGALIVLVMLYIFVVMTRMDEDAKEDYDAVCEEYD